MMNNEPATSPPVDGVLFPRIWRYPVTSVLLCVTCAATVLFSMLSLTDPALLLAVGSPAPIRIDLWPARAEGAKATASTAEQYGFAGALGKKTSRGVASETVIAGTGVVAWHCVVWLFRYLWGQTVVVSSGEWLLVLAALVTFAAALERRIGIHCFFFTLLVALLFRLVWCVSLLLVGWPSAPETFRLRPGPGWLCLVWYCMQAVDAARHRAWSRLRIFGKIPLGPGLLHLVIVLELAMRMDLWMELVPSVVVAVIVCLPCFRRIGADVHLLPLSLIEYIERHRSGSDSDSEYLHT